MGIVRFVFSCDQCYAECRNTQYMYEGDSNATLCPITGESINWKFEGKERGKAERATKHNKPKAGSVSRSE